MDVALAVVVVVVAFVAGLSTFLLGFGLGTLLLPLFALVFPPEVAVAMTALVHLPSSVFKLHLVRWRASAAVALRFGVPAIAAAFVGAWALAWFATLAPLLQWRVGTIDATVTPIKLAIAICIVVFVALDLRAGERKAVLSARGLALGGLAAGFCGGFSGHQGVLRSAFLLRTGLDKRRFVGTSALVAIGIDLARVSVYAECFQLAASAENLGLVASATVGAFAGALLGRRVLERVDLARIERVLAVALVVLASALAAGLV